jgi:hypothetical protein
MLNRSSQFARSAANISLIFECIAAMVLRSGRAAVNLFFRSARDCGGEEFKFIPCAEPGQITDCAGGQRERAANVLMVAGIGYLRVLAHVAVMYLLTDLCGCYGAGLIPENRQRKKNLLRQL